MSHSAIVASGLHLSGVVVGRRKAASEDGKAHWTVYRLLCGDQIYEVTEWEHPSRPVPAMVGEFVEWFVRPRVWQRKAGGAGLSFTVEDPREGEP